MRITKSLAIQTVNLDDEREMDALVDQTFTVGLERVCAAGDDLRSKEILDSKGNLHRKELRSDMREGTDRDFVG